MSEAKGPSGRKRARREPKNPEHPGRPHKEIDLEVLQAALRIHPTFGELGAMLGISERTVERWYAEDDEFRELVDRGREDARASQRRAYMAAVHRVANGSSGPGDSTLLIFLSKQRSAIGGLGFRDRTEHEHSGEVRSYVDLVVAATGGEDPEGEGDA